VGTPAHEIRLEYKTSGKPALVLEQNPGRLRFNISHSRDLALIAVFADNRLGVDLENMRAEIDIVSLSSRFFSARECTSLAALPQNLRLRAFLACWTRKEAFVKATGDGLSFPLSDFTVSTHPELSPKIEEILGDSGVAQRWFLADISPKLGYYASVAVEGIPTSLETYEWN
jgi:4'-phosphopantetheinyl transferase